MRLGLWRQGFWQNEKDQQGVGRCQRAGKIKRRGKGDFAQDSAEQWSTDKAKAKRRSEPAESAGALF